MATTSTVTVHAKEAFYIRAKHISPSVKDALDAHYTHLFFEDKACGKCEFEADRPCDVCYNCAAFKGGAKMSQQVVINEKKYIRTPIGDKKGLLKILSEDFSEDDIIIKPQFGNTPMKRKIKFTGELDSKHTGKVKHQREAVDAIKKKKRGVIKAPPRSGKTVLSTAAVCEIGLKTMIVAAQNTWLRGFQETFTGSESQIPLTNAKKSQVGFAKTLEDFEKYDVCLVTYQTFLHKKGKKLLKKIRNMFGVMIIDEVHMAAAEGYASFVAKINTKYKIGLSGTPSRKDQKFIIAADLIGPVIYDAKVERLRPTVRLTRTDYKKDVKGNVNWSRMVSALENDKARLKLIAKWAVRDIENDDHFVIIPMAQVKPILALVKLINQKAGKKIVAAYYGKVKPTDQEIIVQKSRKYKLKGLVGNAKMVSTGLNIPRASALYETIVSSNLENAEQRYARVLTPMPGKPTPIIRFFLDEMSIRKRCMMNEYYNTLVPKFKPLITDKDKEILKGYFSAKNKANMDITTPGLYG